MVGLAESDAVGRAREAEAAGKLEVLREHAAAMDRTWDVVASLASAFLEHVGVLEDFGWLRHGALSGLIANMTDTLAAQ